MEVGEEIYPIENDSFLPGQLDVTSNFHTDWGKRISYALILGALADISLVLDDDQKFPIPYGLKGKLNVGKYARYRIAEEAYRWIQGEAAPISSSAVCGKIDIDEDILRKDVEGRLRRTAIRRKIPVNKFFCIKTQRACLTVSVDII